MIASAAAMAHWLRENQQADGRILDPVHGETGSYASGFAALAFGLMATSTGEQNWWVACHCSLEAARRRPYHSEFDQLALLLLLLETAKAQRAGPAGKPAAELGLAPDQVRLYRGGRLVSNNWVAMRAASHVLRAHFTRMREDWEQAAGLWEKVLRWQSPDGLFVDSPGGDATPVTYHAKFCALLALVLSETELQTDSMWTALWNGLEALAAFVSPAGALVPYGRSRNTLFGCAAAIFALRRGSLLLAEPLYREVAGRLEARLGRFQCQDGHIPCVLNQGEAVKADWDVYVNNPDYNAYAAALLLLASRSPGRSSECAAFRRRATVPSGGITRSGSPVLRQVGPILTVQNGDLFAAFVARGQAVPVGTPFFCDHRQYGLQPLWIERGETVLLEPARYRWPAGQDRTALVDPGANPWIPYVAVGPLHYCVRRYDQVTVEQAGSVVRIEGLGRPEVYHPVPRWERGVRALFCPTTGRPAPVFRTAALDGVQLRYRIDWDVYSGLLLTAAEVTGDLPAAASVHQRAVTWSASSRISGLDLVPGWRE